MVIDFTGVSDVQIPEGNVIKIERKSDGAVLWEKIKEGVIVLDVEKVTSDTYAGDTTYSGEQFVLLDIYPKTYGTVSVSYGGLTKTITDTSGAESPNAQSVFFGTFNSASDSVSTPLSGILTIDGDYSYFTCASYNKAKSTSSICDCIKNINNTGYMTMIANNAFFQTLIGSCNKIINVKMSDYITTIGESAFYNCTGLESVIIPASVTSIYKAAFKGCTALTNITFLGTTPPAVTSTEMFEGSTCQITVPNGCGDIYRNAGYFTEYADRIVEAS